MNRSYTHAQHFLRGKSLIAELIGHSNIRKNDTVYDLGAGTGAITSVLANRCKWVIAVEIEPVALAKLRQNMQSFPNVTIVKSDILALPIPCEPYKIFSNIPFSLSAEIVHKFTECAHPPKAIYLIVQKQFAQKIIPGDDHFTGQLGSELAPLFSARIRRPLRRTDFTPPPGVDTVLLELKLREEPLIPAVQLPAYREFIKRCYSEQKYFTSLPRAMADLSPELLPSQLTIEQWCRLFAVVHAKA